MIHPTHPISFHQFSPGRWQAVQGSAIVEQTVSLTVNSEVWLSFMCTPVDLEAMAVGFLWNEGLLESANEIADVRLCASGDNVDVWTNKPLEMPTRWRRTSGCTGGTTSVEAEDIEFTEEKTGSEPAKRDAPASHERPRITMKCSSQEGSLTPLQLSELVVNLFEGQTLYREAGGVHSSALSDGTHLVVSAEDIGRHNTLDKIAGKCLREAIQIPNGVVLSTGRISSEMLQKSARLGAAVVVSRTAASSLAIQLAESWGITLIGYARRERFNVYTHPERIILPTRSPLPVEIIQQES